VPNFDDGEQRAFDQSLTGWWAMPHEAGPAGSIAELRLRARRMRI
jgi:hypothetical protein